MAKWKWEFSSGVLSSCGGVVDADTLCRALSRITASPAGSRLAGNPLLQGSPGDEQTCMDIRTGDSTFAISCIFCESESSGENNKAGCGSKNLAGPDCDGLLDCLDCGHSFCFPK